VAGYSGDVPERIGGAVASEAASRGTQEVRQFLRTDPTITVPQASSCHLMLEEPFELAEPYQDL
jgi:hypothetical protein